MKTKLMMILTALLTASGFSQSAQVMDSIISSQKLTYGQAAYLVFTGTERIEDDADIAYAFNALKESGWIKPAALPEYAESAISLKTYAFLLMNAFSIKGGMHYHILPVPRYAYRDLQYYAVIQGSPDPDSTITGVTAIGMIGRAAGLKGGEQ